MRMRGEEAIQGEDTLKLEPFVVPDPSKEDLRGPEKNKQAKPVADVEDASPASLPGADILPGIDLQPGVGEEAVNRL